MNTLTAAANLAEYYLKSSRLLPSATDPWVALHTEIAVAQDAGTFEARRAEFAERVRALRASK